MSLDLTGQRFGRLTVLEKTAKRKSKCVVWLCQCDCGNTVEVTSTHLTCGDTTSCGCARKGVNRIDLTGQRFGRLVAITPANKRRGNSVIWCCQCDCGKIANVASINLRNGNTKSCGCLASEVRRDTASTAMWAVRAEDYVEGTDVKRLMQPPSAANTSGTVGVSYDKTVKLWKAYIQFKGKRYYLGGSTDKETAVRIRKTAELHIHGAFLEWYRTECKGASESTKSPE